MGQPGHELKPFPYHHHLARVGNSFLFNGSMATADYRIELVVGGVVVASDTGASPLNDMTWTTMPVRRPKPLGKRHMIQAMLTETALRTPKTLLNRPEIG